MRTTWSLKHDNGMKSSTMLTTGRPHLISGEDKQRDLDVHNQSNHFSNEQPNHINSTQHPDSYNQTQQELCKNPYITPEAYDHQNVEAQGKCNERMHASH